MKNSIIAAICVASAVPASAGIVYFDLNDLAVPFFDEAGLEGVYINILTGDTALSRPGSFDTAPWLNLFQGGTGIANSELLRPWTSFGAGETYDPDAGYFVNLALGTVIDTSGHFLIPPLNETAESVSVNHMGIDTSGNKFVSGQQGYLAFAYDLPLGGGVAYGWISFTPNSAGNGISFDFARTTTAGEAILVGAIPEPAAYGALAGSLGLLTAVAVRRRRAV